MKFKADRQILMNGIGTVIRSVPNRSTLSILECILIKADSTGLTLTANDMETAIQTHVDADVQENGLIAVEARLFHEIIRKMPDREIKFASDEKFAIRLTAGKSKFSIGGRDGREFTGIPDIGSADSYTMPQELLKGMVQTTIFAADASGDNRIMNGEYLEVKDGIFSITALDGHRIARRRASVNFVNDISAIVPSKALSDVSKLLSDGDEPVTISISANHAMFKFGETFMVVRLVDGKYFDVDRMVSFGSETEISVNKTELVSCMERALLFTREGNTKPIILDATDDEIRFSIRSNMGEMSETLDADKTGQDLAIGFNPKFMLDALRAVPDDTVTLRMINQKSPCFITDDDGSYLYLVLPVQFVR